jgi:hypothetical protein
MTQIKGENFTDWLLAIHDSRPLISLIHAKGLGAMEAQRMQGCLPLLTCSLKLAA